MRDAPRRHDALDAWMAARGRQRALPHPRTGRAVDFLFTVGGQRIGPSRIRRGLAAAIGGTGLRGPTGQPLHITPTNSATPTPPAWSTVG